MRWLCLVLCLAGCECDPCGEIRHCRVYVPMKVGDATIQNCISWSDRYVRDPEECAAQKTPRAQKVKIFK